MIQVVNGGIEIDFDLVPEEEEAFFEFVIEEIGLREDLYFYDFKIIKTDGNTLFYLISDVCLYLFFSLSNPIRGKKYLKSEVDLIILKGMALDFPELNLANIESLDRLINRKIEVTEK